MTNEKNINEILKSKLFYALSFGKYDITLVFTAFRSFHITTPSMIILYERLFLTLPSKRSVSSIFFMDLFQAKLWIGILAVYTFFLGFFMIYCYMHKLNFNQFVELVFHVFGISSERITFSTFSLSICIIILTLLYYILGEFFTAFLTSKLALKPDLPFHNLEDFSLQSKYKLCTEAYTRSENILSNNIKFNNKINGPECNNLRESLVAYNGSLILKSLCDDPYLTLIMPALPFMKFTNPHVG